MTDHATITLVKGNGHDCGENGEGCLFEWYNYLTIRETTDTRPAGVSPMLHQFGMSLNDVLPDDRRQELVRFLPNGTSPLAGTEHDGRDEIRGYMALDWLVRTYTPAWLDLVPALAADAGALRALDRIDGLAAAELAGPAARLARDHSAAAWAAARDAAGDAAGAAAGAAARDAARAAAWAAAWDAARAAARDAARAAARDAARAAAGAAAWDAARAAARDAARAAARDGARAAARAAAWAAARDAARARAAAGAAAWAALAPTVATLQQSAISLYDQMIAGVWPDGV